MPIPAAITEVASPTESSVTSTPDSTDSALEPDAADEPYFPIANGVNVVQLTDTEGVGRRPLLAWEPAEGAAGYTIVVFDGDNSPYWAALTSETEIYIGGSTQIPEGNDGPIISEGYQWVVYADDADGVPIGSSPLRPISPKRDCHLRTGSVAGAVITTIPAFASSPRISRRFNP